MEKAYFDDNRRENELTKHFSLRLHGPEGLIALRATGCCEVDLPEWVFDLDYPGHYLRRIKSVSISLPCVLGPYQTVNAKLTLLSSRTRLTDSLEGGYPEQLRRSEGDTRFYRMDGIHEAISTTGGQNDSGMFEMNFKDERLLPFEGNGVISRWRIELPQESNWFDIETLTDAILHIRYTSQEGSRVFRDAAMSHATDQLPSSVKTAKTRIVDLKHDLPAEWEKLIENSSCCSPTAYTAENPRQSGSSESVCSTICLCLDRERFFPWHRKSTPARVSHVDLIVQSKDKSIELEKINYWVGNKEGSATAHLIEDCLIDGTYKAELKPAEGVGHALNTWKVELPKVLKPDAIYFLVHYYYEMDSTNARYDAHEKLAAPRKGNCQC